MNRFKIDFELTDHRIRIGSPSHEHDLRHAERELNISFPPSFQWWLCNIASEAIFDIGNLLQVYPLFSEGESPSIFSETKRLQGWNLCTLKDLIVFGSNGVDGEMWAFYTGSQSPSGEYPIIWVAPSLMADAPYALCNSRFDRFLNVQVQWLMAGDSEPALTYEEASDTDAVARAEEEDRACWLQLYKKYDPLIEMATDDLYELATTATEIREQARCICEPRRT